MADDHEFVSGSADAAETELTKGSALRTGKYCMLKNNPCKIVSTSTSKTGKHGSAKVHITGLDIFTGKKCEEIFSSTADCKCPIVLRKDYSVLDITEDGFLTLMDEGGATREDIKLPEGDLGKLVREKLDKGDEDCGVTVQAAMGKEAVTEHKTMKN